MSRMLMSFCVGLGRLYSKLTTSSGRVQPTGLPNFILAGFGHEPISIRMTRNDEPVQGGYDKWMDKANWSSRMLSSQMKHAKGIVPWSLFCYVVVTTNE